MTRGYSAETCGTPANRNAGSLRLFNQVVVEPVRVGGIGPIWLSLSEGTTSRALTTGTIAIHDRVDDQTVCAAVKQLLAELLDPSVG